MELFNVGNRIMNTYLYKNKYGYIMIDTGYPKSLSKVKKKLSKKGIKLTDISYIFLTHAHDDHAGFLNELLGVNKGLKVIVHSKAMQTSKKGQNPFDGGCSSIMAFMFCKLMELAGNGDHTFPKISEEYRNQFIEIKENNLETLEEILGGKILFTSGHTKDSISLKIDNIIFCGDAAMNGIPSIKRFTIWIEDKVAYEYSWEKLLAENPIYIYPSHGNPFKTNDLLKFKKDISRIKLYKLR